MGTDYHWLCTAVHMELNWTFMIQLRIINLWYQLFWINKQFLLWQLFPSSFMSVQWVIITLHLSWDWSQYVLPVTTIRLVILFIHIFFFFSNIFWGDFFLFCLYNIQYCFICRPSDSTVPTDAGIEPRTVATGALAVRHSNHWARSHPHWARSHPHWARSHPRLG